MHGILVYFKPRERKLESDKVVDESAYDVMTKVFREFISPVARARRALVVEAEPGMACFFENPQYFYDVIVPNLRYNPRFMRKFLSPNLRDIAKVLSRDERWMVFGPFFHQDSRIYELYHIAKVEEIPREYWSAETYNFLTSLVRRSKRLGFYEFDVAISPAIVEEIDIYELPDICSEELEYSIYEEEPLVLSFFVIVDSTLVYIEEDSAERIFEFTRGVTDIFEEQAIARKRLSLDFTERQLSVFKKIKELEDFAEELLRMRCDTLVGRSNV